MTIDISRSRTRAMAPQILHQRSNGLDGGHLDPFSIKDVAVVVIPAEEDVTQLARQKTVVKFCPITRDAIEAPPLMVGRKGEFRWAFSSDFEKIAGFSQPDPKDVNWITSSKAGIQGPRLQRLPWTPAFAGVTSNVRTLSRQTLSQAGEARRALNG